MRKWIFALALMLAVPALGAAAPIVAGPVEEQLVEGHTVFSVIEVCVYCTDTEQREFHAAVAVLVREVEQRVNAQRFPGVLWFNDQYLVGPSLSVEKEVDIRYPCTGAVLATPTGEGDARTLIETAEYVESYHVTDPNDHAWDVDRWAVTTTTQVQTGTDPLTNEPIFTTVTEVVPIWSVAVVNNQVGYGVPDNGSCEGTVFTDNPCGGPIVLPTVYDEITPPYRDNGVPEGRVINAGGVPGTLCATPGYKEVGDNGFHYPCGTSATANTPDYCPNIKYNALLYFRLKDLGVAYDPATGILSSNGQGFKDHRDGSVARGQDVSGCHETSGDYTYTTGDWPCPPYDGDKSTPGDDDREGNSHDYNPERPWPLLVYDGRNNHGGSYDCVTTAAGYEQDCHATADVDIFFHHLPIAKAAALQVPGFRQYFVYDVEGSTAPFHCHSDMEYCNQDEVVADPAGYASWMASGNP